jgi:hypothetical protein
VYDLKTESAFLPQGAGDWPNELSYCLYCSVIKVLKFSASCVFAGYLLAIPVADMQAFGFI